MCRWYKGLNVDSRAARCDIITVRYRNKLAIRMILLFYKCPHTPTQISRRVMRHELRLAVAGAQRI